MWYEIKNFAVPLEQGVSKRRALDGALLRAKLPASSENAVVLAESLDARGTIRRIYRLALRSDSPVPDALPLEEEDLQNRLHPVWTPPERPKNLSEAIVVGTGPAGIFGALSLALAGCRVLVLDRGEKAPERARTIDVFSRTRDLNENSNLLIGEGGAGTFSDGKLYTGTRDARAAFVLHEYIQAGAPRDIAILHRPHIGSDLLCGIAEKLRAKIESLGGEFRFDCSVEDLEIAHGRVSGVRLSSGEVLSAPAVLCAHGLGARALTQKLCGSLKHEVKGFQIGCRIEHPQVLIDRAQYHFPTRPAVLEAAEYHYVSRPKNGAPHVSTFCMCPGGTVLQASAWRGRSVSNGMSRRARDGKYANGCLILTLDGRDFNSVQEAYAFLASREEAAFALGGGDYALPAQGAANFLRGIPKLLRTESSCPTGVRGADLNSLFGGILSEGLCAALREFDRRCPGFIAQGQLLGFESCVSSPVRFERNPETGESSLPGFFPAGEGAGCAGGILSAAADGVFCAEGLLRSYGN